MVKKKKKDRIPILNRTIRSVVDQVEQRLKRILHIIGFCCYWHDCINILQPQWNTSTFNEKVTLKIPAIDKVRLDVQETRRNSEKLRPKASRPPLQRQKSECRNGESSVTRNNLSEVLRLSPGNRTHAGLEGSAWTKHTFLASSHIWMLMGTDASMFSLNARDSFRHKLEREPTLECNSQNIKRTKHSLISK